MKWISQGRALQAERTAGAKALRLKHACHVQRRERNEVGSWRLFRQEQRSSPGRLYMPLWGLWLFL